MPLLRPLCSVRGPACGVRATLGQQAAASASPPVKRLYRLRVAPGVLQHLSMGDFTSLERRRQVEVAHGVPALALALILGQQGQQCCTPARSRGRHVPCARGPSSPATRCDS